MVAAHESFNRRHPKARLMDHELAVQEAVGLRTQSKLDLGIAAAAKTADGAGRDGRPERAARGRRAAYSAADRATGAGIGRVRTAAGVGDYVEFLGAEILPVQIK